MTPRTWALVLAMSLLAGGCRAVPGTGGGDGGAGDAGTPGDGGLPPGSVTVGNWNLDWFGDTQYGPADDALQQRNVTTVLKHYPASLWALEEVVDAGRLAVVAQDLGGFGELTAADAQVTGHSDYQGTQQTAILYDPTVISVRSAQVVLGADQYDFAGRPPFVVAVDVHTASGVFPLTVVVVHMKAYADQRSYDRRLAASKALKTWLDQTHASDPVLVLGDWNDDLDTSDYAGSPSPYANFVSDTADYTFPTLVFTEQSIGTYVGSSDPIDHQMVTNELAPDVVGGSPTVVHPPLSSYRSTTSDHYPVQVSYQLQ